MGHFFLSVVFAVFLAAGAPLLMAFSLVESTNVRFENGKLTLEGPVALENEWGRICAQRGEVQLSDKERQVEKSELVGDVLVSLAGKGQLECQRAVFDRQQGEITLTADPARGGNVRFTVFIKQQQKDEAPLMGSAKRMRIFLEKEAFRIARVEAEEEVVISWGEELSATCRAATLLADQLTLSQEVHFYSHQGTAACDEALIAYEGGLGEFQLQTLQLLGNVRLTHREGAVLQLAVADHAIYHAPLAELHLKSSSGQKVHCLDRVNNLKMSAQEIIVRKNPLSKDPFLKGVGDVHFTFSEKEYELFKKRFFSDKQQKHKG